MPAKLLDLTDAPGAFSATNWSIVRACGEEDEAKSRLALAELCRIYWYPLYAFVRRRGYGVEDAQDLTQGFFQHVLERGVFQQADRSKGKFRSFLLASLQNYLADDFDRSHSWKRGGRVELFSLDDERAAEVRYVQDEGSDLSPENVFETRWAATVLTRALACLRAEFSGERRAKLFESLEPFVTLAGDSPRYDEVAASLHITLGTVKSMVHRLRQRYRTCLREEIGRTVSDPAEIDDEIRHLCAVLRSGGVVEIG